MYHKDEEKGKNILKFKCIERYVTSKRDKK